MNSENITIPTFHEHEWIQSDDTDICLFDEYLVNISGTEHGHTDNHSITI